MDRRAFLAGTGAVLLAAPLATEAQQAEKAYWIGLLQIQTRERLVPYLKAFEEGLRELGYVEGRDFVREYRFADQQRERLPDLAAELVRLKVDVIVTGTDPGTVAASQATATIPIVMALRVDPVKAGLIASLRRAGGNVTGLLAVVGPEIEGKRLEHLKEIVPRMARVACFWNPDIPGYVAFWKATEEAARKLGVTLLSVEVREPREIEAAFARITRERAQALVVIADGLALTTVRPEIPARRPSTGSLPATQLERLWTRGGLCPTGPAWPICSAAPLATSTRSSRARSRAIFPSSSRPSSSWSSTSRRPRHLA